MGLQRVGHEWVTKHSTLHIILTNANKICILIKRDGIFKQTKDRTKSPQYYKEYLFKEKSKQSSKILEVIYFLFIYFYFTILYWFCHTSTWICHRYTRVPQPEPVSLLPPRTIPLGHPCAPAPSIQYAASNLEVWLSGKPPHQEVKSFFLLNINEILSGQQIEYFGNDAF